MGVLTSTMKCSLYLINSLFMLLGLIIVIIGSLVIAQSHHLHEEIVPFHPGGAIVSVIIGSGIVMVCVLGCMGAKKEDEKILMVYGSILFVLFLIMMILSGLVYASRGEVRKLSSDEYNKYIKDYPKDEKVREAVDYIQSDFKCCGGTDYNDWLNRSLPIPGSCCGNDSPKKECQATEAYKKGCLSLIKDKILKYLSILGGVGIAFGIFLFVGVAVSCLLARVIRQQ